MAYGMLQSPEDLTNPLMVFYSDWERIREAILKGDKLVSSSFFTNGLVNKEEGELIVIDVNRLSISSISSGLFYDGLFLSLSSSVVKDCPSNPGDYFVYARVAEGSKTLPVGVDRYNNEHSYDVEELDVSFRHGTDYSYGIKLGKIRVSVSGSGTVVLVLDSDREQAYLKDKYVNSISHLLNPDHFIVDSFGRVSVKLFEDYNILLGRCDLFGNPVRKLRIRGKFYDEDGYYNYIGIGSSRVRFPDIVLDFDIAIDDVSAYSGRLANTGKSAFQDKTALVFAYRRFKESGEEVLGYGLYPQPSYRITGIEAIGSGEVRLSFESNVAFMNERASFVIFDKLSGTRELVLGIRRYITSSSIVVSGMSGSYSNLSNLYLVQIDKFVLYSSSGEELYGGEYRFLEFGVLVDSSESFTGFVYSTYPFVNVLKKPSWLFSRFHDFINYAYDKLVSLFNVHKTEGVLDHPDASVTTDKLSDASVTAVKLKEEVINLFCPIGSIIAWHKHLRNEDNPLSLPLGWIECNGQNHTLEDGTTVESPDLNGNKNSWNSKGSFLRGDSTSGVMENDALQNHTHIDSGHRHSIREDTSGEGASMAQESGQTEVNQYNTEMASANLGGASTYNYFGTPRTSRETRPVNMSVVWIMRVE